MGLIKSAKAAISTTLKDQYKEFFVCDNMGSKDLIMPGVPRHSETSTNNGSKNIISDGSVIIVGAGQCALIVDNGKVVDYCAEAGEYIWDTGTTPSMFNGMLKGLKGAMKQVSRRFKSGGNLMVDQRVFYVNTKIIKENKFGKGGISFKDAEFNFNMNVGIHGLYEYRVINPVFFFENYVGITNKKYTTRQLDQTFKMAVVQSLGPAFARISRKGITYDQIEADINEVTKSLQEELKEKWEDLRGVTVVNINGSTTVDEKSKLKMEKFQEARIMSNPNMAAGLMSTASAEAIKNAASNESGAMNGFIGMGMAMNQGNGMVNNMQQNAQQHNSAQQKNPPADSWKCDCGTVATGLFCSGCGNKKPEPKNLWECKCGSKNAGNFCQGCGSEKPKPKKAWQCKCGNQNTSKFCEECGSSKPEENSNNKWTCQCGTVNQNKFCMNCGSEKPNELDSYCEKCGFKGEEPFKFCPECGQSNDE